MIMAPQRRRVPASPSATPSFGQAPPTKYTVAASITVVALGALYLAAWWAQASHGAASSLSGGRTLQADPGPANPTGTPAAALDSAVRQGMPPGHRNEHFAGAPQPTLDRPASGWRRVASFPHDPAAFTQGLEYRDGWLWESTGLVGRSGVRKVDVRTGEVAHRVDIPSPHFGEGITIVNDTLVEITWQTRKAFLYQWPSLTLRSQVTFSTHSGEGWGICYDGARLIVSDGSAYLTFWDPITLQKLGEVQVLNDGAPLARLNELECVEGEVLANIWYDNHIARINPTSGAVLELLDFSTLDPSSRASGDVLNGIAYDPVGSNDVDGYRLFLTGKLWGKLHEVRWFPKR